MKRRYELNLYTPDQYNDLQEHLGHMASRGWMLERMEQHFLVYRQNVSSPVHYAVAFHPEVGDMDSLRTPALEFYEDLCRQAQWRLVDTWSKYPQIQVYATRQRDPVPLQTDLATHWAVMEDWMEKRYWPKVQGDTAFGSLANLLLAAFALLWVVQGELSILQKILLIGLCSLLMIQVIRHFFTLVHVQFWMERARRARETGAPGPVGRQSWWYWGLTRLLLTLAGVELLLFLLYLGWNSPVQLVGFSLLLLANVLSAWLSGKLRRHLRWQETSALLNYSIFFTANILMALFLVWVLNRVF